VEAAFEVFFIACLSAACGGHTPADPTTPTASATATTSGAEGAFACGDQRCPDSNFCLEYESDGQIRHLCRPTPDGCQAPATCDCIMQQGWHVGMCADDGGTHSVAIFTSPP
jgi:hypothetical protein